MIRIAEIPQIFLLSLLIFISASSCKKVDDNPSDGNDTISDDDSLPDNDSVLVIGQFHIFHFTQLNSDIPDSFITALTVDHNHVVWMGVDKKGLVSFDGVTWTTYNQSNSQLPSNNIYSITIDKMNGVWVGTDKGLASFSNGVWQIFNVGNAPFMNDSIVVVRCDSSNNIWVGNSNQEYCGLVRSAVLKFDGASWTVYNADSLKFPLNIINDIEIDPLNRVWIGLGRSSDCTSGLIVFDGANTDTIQMENSYPINYSYDFKEIAFDPDGYMWVNSYHPLPYTVYTAQFDHIYNAVSLEDDASNSALNLPQLTYYPRFAFTQSLKWISSGRIIDSYYLFPEISYYDVSGWHTLVEGDFNSYDVTCMATSWPDTVWMGTLEGLLKIY